MPSSAVLPVRAVAQRGNESSYKDKSRSVRRQNVFCLNAGQLDAD